MSQHVLVHNTIPSVQILDSFQRKDVDTRRHYCVEKFSQVLSTLKFHSQIDASDKFIGLCTILRGYNRVSARRQFMVGIK